MSIIDVWSLQIAPGKAAEARDWCKRLAAAHRKRGINARAMRLGTGTSAELMRIYLTMEYDSLAASEADLPADKGEEIDALHKEASDYTVQGTLAHHYFRTFE